MSTETTSGPPVLSVIHYDVGEDRSISVQDFLRGLKRDYNSSLLQLRARKRLRRSPSIEPRPQQRIPSKETVNLPPVDDTPTDIVYPVPSTQALVERQRPEENDSSKSDGNSQSLNDRIPRVRKTYGRKPAFSTTPSIAGQGLRGNPLSRRGLDKTLGREERSKKQRKRARRRAPVSELVLMGVVNGLSPPHNMDNPALPASDDSVDSGSPDGLASQIGVHNHANGERMSMRKPLSRIRTSIRLSRNESVHLEDFKIPPMTPVATEAVAWRPGGGFKDRARTKPRESTSASKAGRRTSKPPIREGLKPIGSSHDPSNQEREHQKDDIASHAEEPQAHHVTSRVGTLEDSCQIIGSPQLKKHVRGSQHFGENHSTSVSSTSTSEQAPIKKKRGKITTFPANHRTHSIQEIHHPQDREPTDVKAATSTAPMTSNGCSRRILAAPGKENTLAIRSGYNPSNQTRRILYLDSYGPNEGKPRSGDLSAVEKDDYLTIHTTIQEGSMSPTRKGFGKPMDISKT
ncbi:MAG: hypothetical protein Q9181_000830 [Wetmoreana brouardii]